ncbi:DUF1840 domain-containing protein [Orrella daihaiensis]|uniref:DUF1840 domain-containing protein n=1 Tax=Orrella daihaiensis TaxID=2782176 RepID=A0ABY4AK27_9BURK|nr:DUF1840 domain-containing protein [Orrella daihaiensis]UOD50544.1 DUF1840 domain-containing protein [Orrella daihaiensis]
MLVTFSSKVDADVLMMGEHAKQVLKAAGKEIGTTVPERGVFTAEQLDQAIANLERAIAAEQPRPAPDDDDDERKAKEHVLLEQRAYPVLAMMRKAKQANAPVMWETGSGW